MDVSLESESLPNVGNSRKSYLQVTSQRIARGKLVHLNGRRSLALPSVGPGSQKSNASNGAQFGAEMKELQPLEAEHHKLKANFAALRNQPFAAKRHPLVISCELEKGRPRLKITLNGKCNSERYEPLQVASVINFVDYSLNQGASAGHESTETPIGHESAKGTKKMIDLYYFMKIVVGGSCEDDGSAVEVEMLGMDASISPVVGCSGGIVCSTRGGAYDGSVGSDGIGMVCSGVNRIPRSWIDKSPMLHGDRKNPWESLDAPYGVFLGALRRLEGDEDLSSLVFCHGYLREGSRRCTRGLGSDGGPLKGYSVLAPLSHQRRRGVFVVERQFRSRGAFSQPISQLQNEGVGLRNGTRVLRGGFAAAKPAAKWGYGYEIGIFKALGIS
uniref:Uncharacterized protein n=1 Tax=Vitis vinifera TaxID=29760 RepID=A5ADG2_VITVI|nr:hypothetical protein VITISV_043766 [Vitis vinifera]